MPEVHRPSQIARRFHMIIRVWILSLWFCAEIAVLAAAQEPPRANFDELLRQLPALQRHEGGKTAEAVTPTGEAYETFLKEKLSGRWFAAFVPNSPPGSYEI